MTAAQNPRIAQRITTSGGTGNGTPGTNGTNGVDGTNGTNGVDGSPTPVVVITSHFPPEPWIDGMLWIDLEYQP